MGADRNSIDKLDLPTGTKRERAAALASTRVLAPLLRRSDTVRLRVEDGDKDAVIEVPRPLLRPILALMTEFANGNPVRMLPLNAELTTQEAADLLKVSRPHLVQLLERGDIPHRLVGTHRRVRFTDVVNYRRTQEAKRRGALDELVSLSQALDLY